MSVILIGYRGSGKTTVGRLLAERRGVAFIDTDEMIVQFAGRSIAEVFRAEGEAGFRRREEQAIRMSTAQKGRIISVGGGAVESKENRRLLRAYGTVVWLEAPPETLWERMQEDRTTGDSRPDLGGGGLEEVREVLARRAPLYASTSHVALRVAGLTQEQVVSDIEAWLAAE